VCVSRDTLSRAEVDDRTDWLNCRRRLLAHYNSGSATSSALVTAADFLQQRVAPPPLVSAADGISRRESLADTKAERKYGPTMNIWEDFERLASEYSPPAETNAAFSETLLLSLKKTGKLSSEQQEQTYFQKNVLAPLENAGLLKYEAGGTTGEDITLTTTDAEDAITATAVVEFKSTHNMLLLAAAEDVVNLFNQHCTTSCTNEITANSVAGRAGTRIGHTVGQAVGYMEDKKVTFGAITSGTRTFFLCLKPKSDRASRTASVHFLHISGPWLVGQPGYLEAWAYFAKEAEGSATVACNVDTKAWFGTPTKNKSTKDGDGGGSGGRPVDRKAKKQKKEKKTNETKSGRKNAQGTVASIPLVSFQDIPRVKPLGHGRNGTVYLGLWQEQYVAMKQFDVSKYGGRHYERELAAYALAFRLGPAGAQATLPLRALPIQPSRHSAWSKTRRER
jgi:hypothetical protein